MYNTKTLSAPTLYVLGLVACLNESFHEPNAPPFVALQEISKLYVL